MNGGKGLKQTALGSFQGHLVFRNINSLEFCLCDDAFCLFYLLLDFHNEGLYLLSPFVASGALVVAIGANRSQHFHIRFLGLMGLMTRDTLSHLSSLHGSQMRTSIEVLEGRDVTLAAHVLHLSHPRGQGSVISMTASTGGRTAVVFLQ